MTASDDGSLTVDIRGEVESDDQFTVEVYLEEDYDSGDPLQTAGREGGGKVFFSGLPVGENESNKVNYVVVVNGEYHVSTTETVSLYEPTQTSDSITSFVQRKRAEVTGDIVNEDDEALPDANVELTNADSNEQIDSTTASSSGAYSFTDVPVGYTYDVTATFDGKNGSTTIDINSDGTYAGTDIVIVGASTVDPASFDIGVLSSNLPVEAGNDVEADIEVENVGDESATKTVMFTLSTQEQDYTLSEDIQLAGGATTTQTVTFSTSGEDAGEALLLAESEDDGDSISGNITEPDSAPAAFEVSIQNTNFPIEEGDPFEMEVAIENIGEESGARTVDYTLDTAGEEYVTGQNVSLAGGASTTETISFPTSDGDAGGATASVSTAEDSAGVSGEITAVVPPTFEVEILETNAPVAGEDIQATVEVTNVGTSSGTETVELTTTDGALETNQETVTLTADASTTRTITLPTSQGDAGTYTLSAQTSDDDDVRSITVSEPTVPASFTIQSLDTNTPVAGDDLDVVADVENTGDESDTTQVTVEVSGLGEESERVTLTGGQTTQVSFSFLTGEQDVGSYTATVETSDDSKTAPVRVTDPAAIVITDVELNETSQGEPIEATVEVENTGAENDTQRLELTIPEVGTDAVSVSLEGSKSTTETLSTGTRDVPSGEYEAIFETEDDEVRRTVDVTEPGVVLITNVTVTETAAGEPLEAAVTLENPGDEEATRTIGLDAGSLGTEEIPVTLDGGETRTETVEFETTAEDAGEYEVSATDGEDVERRVATVVEPGGESGQATFQVSDVVVEENEVSIGDPVAVEAVITNSGNDSGAFLAELEVDGEVVDTRQVTELDPSDSVPATFEWSPTEAGNYTISVSGETAESSLRVENESVGGGGDRSGQNEETEAITTDWISGPPGFLVGGVGLLTVLGGYLVVRRSGGEDDAPPTQQQPEANKQATAGQGKNSEPTQQSRTTERARASDGRSTSSGGVPNSIPSPPVRRHSIAYEDIRKGDPLGKGGNADVFYARTTVEDSELELALKEPRMSGTIQTSVVEQMMTEAETWQKLDDHDHIVGVIDYGSNPLPWIAMEYMDGGHLGERIDQTSLQEKIWISLAVSQAVKHAHNHGIAHLDLKPANILFRRIDGAWDVPKVADWGLSKHLLEHSKSMEGMSPHYAAPEQFDPDSYGAPDQSTDVYQLGAVFYEVFTGRPPFEGKPFEVMKQVEAEEPPPPSEIASVPAGIDDVLLQALATAKSDRYEDVLLLRNDLRAVLEQL